MNFVTTPRFIVSGIVLGLAALPLSAQEGSVEDFSSMVTQGKASLDMRYRYEYVDQDGFDDEAKASTLRSRLTLASAVYEGFSFLTAFSNVTYIGDDDFNSTENGNTEYPVVADPKGTVVNQAWLKYAWNDLSGAYGRQVINHGDQRFVGAVAWRQNEQTYDGFRAQWSGDHGLSVDYAYVYNVNRIFGPDNSVAQPADWDGDFNFLRLDYKFLENHSIAGFAYSLEVDDRSRWSPNKTVNNSSMTYGVQYNGKFGPFAAKASYATQSDAGDSYLNYDADYYLVEGGANFWGMNARIGYEVLGSDNDVGFKTPLATLHKFQGWADKFLVTPGDGIEDFYAGLSGALGPVKLGAYWHDFKAEDSGDDFGSELDLSATWPVNKMFTLQLKYADFSTDDSARFDDTKKAWLTVNFKI